MTTIIEKIETLLKELASDISAFASLVAIVGLFLILAGFFELSGRMVTSRSSTNFPPIILGALLFGIGLSLLIVKRPPKSRNKHAIVFYTPTIKANSFFAALFEHALERAKEKNFDFIIEKSEPGIGFHEAGNYTRVIRDYSGDDSQDFVLIMIPPTVESYEGIWNLPKDLNVNLITLDMEISNDGWADFMACDFHKQIILVDNKQGARIAAAEVADFCQKNDDIKEAINVLICEGNLHNRGRLFQKELERKMAETGLRVNYLSPLREMSFSNAVKEAQNHVYKTCSRATRDLMDRETFIFCANDNMAIGARMGLSNIDPKDLAQYRDIRIISFDASEFIKLHIDLKDRFLWRAVDQKYWEIVNRAYETAEALFRGENIDKNIIEIPPQIYGK